MSPTSTPGLYQGTKIVLNFSETSIVHLLALLTVYFNHLFSYNYIYSGLGVLTHERFEMNYPKRRVLRLAF